MNRCTCDHSCGIDGDYMLLTLPNTERFYQPRLLLLADPAIGVAMHVLSRTVCFNSQAGDKVSHPHLRAPPNQVPWSTETPLWELRNIQDPEEEPLS